MFCAFYLIAILLNDARNYLLFSSYFLLYSAETGDCI